MILSAALLVLLALAMCFMPLFNLLGYESAAATGAVIGFIALIRTARRVEQGHISPLLDMSRPVGPTADFRRLLLEHLALIPLPMLLLALNALRVQNCDLALGARFWLVIPTGAVLIGQSVAWAAAVLPRFRLLAALSIVLVELAAFGYRFAWQPPITGHQWFIGYFSGSIYDEALAMPSSLLWFRALNLCLAVAIVLGVEVAWRRRTARPVRHHVAGVALAVACFFSISGQRFEHNITVTRQDAIDTLGGHLQTEHFDIYYDPGSVDQDMVPLLGEDHEYSYAQLSAWMETDVVAWRDGMRIKSFIYPNRETQKQLLGSRNTMVARPWTNEMHIRWGEYGDNAIPHEMAHLFSAEFGSGPLQLPTDGGLIPNIGMLEGFAEAADWPQDELGPHRASAALRALGKAPDLRRLFDPVGFWSQPSRRAYTVMGSFVRYLVDSYGIDKLKAAYGDGDFTAAYGRSAEDLVTEWEGFMDEHPLTEQDLALADYLYQRGSIFERVCARTIGELARKAVNAERRGDIDQSRTLWDEIVGLEPGNPSHRLSLARIQASDQDHAAARETIATLLAEALSPARRAATQELQGDLAWRSGDLDTAGAAYAAAAAETLPASFRRRLAVKLHGLAQPPPLRDTAKAYLLGDNTRAASLYAAVTWSGQADDDPVPAYLAGLLLYRMGNHEEAVRWLEDASGLEDAALREQRALLLARARYLSGDLDGAERDFQALMQARMPRMRVAAEDGLGRVAWKRQQP